MIERRSLQTVFARRAGIALASFGEYPYKEHYNIKVGGVVLDDIYEAKAFDYMWDELFWSNILTWAKVCFWLIGNSNVLRS
jgi:hypothetical protein